MPFGDTAHPESGPSTASVARHLPVSKSHAFTAPSADAEKTVVPSGLIVQPLTERECPGSVIISSPVPMPHTLSVLSHEEETTRVSSGLIAQPLTEPKCPERLSLRRFQDPIPSASCPMTLRLSLFPLCLLRSHKPDQSALTRSRAPRRFSHPILLKSCPMTRRPLSFRPAISRN